MTDNLAGSVVRILFILGRLILNYKQILRRNKMSKTKLFLSITLALVMVLVSGLAMAVEYKESPELAKRVATGELPPVEDRLPENPLVVKTEGEGQYGGTLRTYMTAYNGAEYLRLFVYETFVRYDSQSDFANVKPGLCDEWEVSDDNKVFTFHLRKGLKWSDGHPFTTEDIRFWYEDLVMDENININLGNAWKAGGEYGELEIVDEQTFKFKFKEPYGTFLSVLATFSGSRLQYYRPAHYLKQFHYKYVGQEKVDKMAEEAGFSDHSKFLKSKENYSKNVDLPMMTAWVWETPPRTAQITYLKRNPYYYKVDEDGNQLPYINKMRIQELEDASVAITPALNGEYDLAARNINTMENKALFAQAMNEGLEMRFVPNPVTNMNTDVIQFNQTHIDPERREIFRNPEFRKAMSYAINRDEMNQLLYFGLGTPSQPAPLKQSAFSHEEYANSYLEYDPEKARQMLDEIGLGEKDSEGWRLLPSGKRFDLTFVSTEDFADSMEVIAGYWKEVGVKTEVRTISFKNFMKGQLKSDRDVVVWGGDGGLEVLQDPRFYIPSQTSFSGWGPLWADWYKSGGESGEEPPADVKNMINWYTEALETSKVSKQQEYMKKIFDQHLERLYVIGVSRVPDSYSVVNSHLKNVPEWWWNSWQLPHPVNSQPWSWYFDNVK